MCTVNTSVMKISLIKKNSFAPWYGCIVAPIQSKQVHSRHDSNQNKTKYRDTPPKVNDQWQQKRNIFVQTWIALRRADNYLQITPVCTSACSTDGSYRRGTAVHIASYVRSWFTEHRERTFGVIAASKAIRLHCCLRDVGTHPAT